MLRKIFVLLALAAAGSSFAATHPYTVDRSTVGNGFVQLDPEWPLYALGERIAIRAIPGAGYRFAGWATDSGYCVPVKDSVVFSRSIRVKAIFQDTAEFVNNGDFFREWTGWTRYKEGALAPVYSIRSGEACILPGGKGNTPTNLQFWQRIRSVFGGTDYRLQFSVHSKANRRFQAVIRDMTYPWTTRKSWPAVQSTVVPRTYTFDFTLASGSEKPRLSFDLGLDSTEICLDSISLRAIPPTLVPPSTLNEEGVLLANVRDRLVVQALSGSSWELRSLDGSKLMGGVFDQGGRQILPDIPRATNFLVLRDPKGKVRSFRVVRF